MRIFFAFILCLHLLQHVQCEMLREGNVTAGASLTKIIEYALHRYCSDGIVHVCNGDESGSLIVCRCGGTFVVQQRSRVEIGNTRESMWLTPDVTSICPEGMLNHSAIEGGDFPLWDDLAYDLAALPRGVRRKELLRTGVPCTREEKIDVPERAPEVTPLSRASLGEGNLADAIDMYCSSDPVCTVGYAASCTCDGTLLVQHPPGYSLRWRNSSSEYVERTSLCVDGTYSADSVRRGEYPIWDDFADGLNGIPDDEWDEYVGSLGIGCIEETKKRRNLTYPATCSPDRRSHNHYMLTYLSSWTRTHIRNIQDYTLSCASFFNVDLQSCDNPSWGPGPQWYRPITRKTGGTYGRLEGRVFACPNQDPFIHVNYVGPGGKVIVRGKLRSGAPCNCVATESGGKVHLASGSTPWCECYVDYRDSGSVVTAGNALTNLCDRVSSCGVGV